MPDQKRALLGTNVALQSANWHGKRAEIYETLAATSSMNGSQFVWNSLHSPSSHIDTSSKSHTPSKPIFSILRESHFYSLGVCGYNICRPARMHNWRNCKSMIHEHGSTVRKYAGLKLNWSVRGKSQILCQKTTNQSAKNQAGTCELTYRLQNLITKLTEAAFKLSTSKYKRRAMNVPVKCTSWTL